MTDNKFNIGIFKFSVELACGGSASQNQTYIVQASATAVSSPCTYTICKCSTSICRIRFDLTTFVLATPQLGEVTAAGVITTGMFKIIWNCRGTLANMAR